MSDKIFEPSDLHPALAETSITAMQELPDLAWEHHKDKSGEPALKLWRVMCVRKFKGRDIMDPNWFDDEQAAWDYSKMRLDSGDEVKYIDVYQLTENTRP